MKQNALEFKDKISSPFIESISLRNERTIMIYIGQSSAVFSFRSLLNAKHLKTEFVNMFKGFYASDHFY